MRPVVVILGVSGRLGRRLVPAFADVGVDTFGVSRTNRGPAVEHLDRWIAADLTVTAERDRLARALAPCVLGRPLYVLDAVLDRRGVDLMRSSVRGATDTVLRLRDELGRTSSSIVLIAASTTAVLAPGLLQTPYGTEKRRQLLTYARAGLTGEVWLLPNLGGATDGHSRQPTWSFDEAAARMAEAPVSVLSHSAFALRVPNITAPAQAAHVARAGRAALIAHLDSVVLDRDSMQAHRDSARARLGLLPRRLRCRIDHHSAPPELVRRFADRHRVTVLDDRPAGLCRWEVD